MSTNQSLLKLEAEKCKSVPTAREQAEAILARMNDMLRVRSFFEVHVEKKFNQLNERLHALGWLGLIKMFTRKGGKYFAHTLNNTVVAPPRMLIAFLENNLNEDGSINIPVALRPYMGGKEVIGK